MREIIARWNHTSIRWASGALSKLASLVSKRSYDPATLGRETGAALRNALYERVRITTHGCEGTFVAETVGKKRSRYGFTAGGLKRRPWSTASKTTCDIAQGTWTTTSRHGKSGGPAESERERRRSTKRRTVSRR